MRSDTEFVASYRKALALVDPATEEMDVEEVRALAQTGRLPSTTSASGMRW